MSAAPAPGEGAPPGSDAMPESGHPSSGHPNAGHPGTDQPGAASTGRRSRWGRDKSYTSRHRRNDEQTSSEQGPSTGAAANSNPFSAVMKNVPAGAGRPQASSDQATAGQGVSGQGPSGQATSAARTSRISPSVGTSVGTAAALDHLRRRAEELEEVRREAVEREKTALDAVRREAAARAAAEAEAQQAREAAAAERAAREAVERDAAREALAIKAATAQLSAKAAAARDTAQREAAEREAAAREEAAHALADREAKAQAALEAVTARETAARKTAAIEAAAREAAARAAAKAEIRAAREAAEIEIRAARDAAEYEAEIRAKAERMAEVERLAREAAQAEARDARLTAELEADARIAAEREAEAARQSTEARAKLAQARGSDGRPLSTSKSSRPSGFSGFSSRFGEGREVDRPLPRISLSSADNLPDPPTVVQLPEPVHYGPNPYLAAEREAAMAREPRQVPYPPRMATFSGTAIAALIFSLLGPLCIVGLLLARTAMREIRLGLRRGTGVVLLAIVISLVWIGAGGYVGYKYYEDHYAHDKSTTGVVKPGVK